VVGRDADDGFFWVQRHGVKSSIPSMNSLPHTGGLLQPPAETAAAAQFYGPEHRTTVSAEFVRCFATPAINHFPGCHGLSGGRRIRSFGKLYIQVLIGIALVV